jgi:shikimate 5-dehydrogenase
MPIDGRTRVAFVLGYPVEHSLSPAMHHAAFRVAGLNAAYLPWSVPPARLEDAVVDLIYRPAETPLLAAARRRGCRAVNGLGMLLHQGALAFERWTGRPAPLDAMRTALERSA